MNTRTELLTGLLALIPLASRSQTEGRREEIAAKARDVIAKNVYTVQQVARLFGEHIAETEIMLKEIAGAYESHTEGKRLRPEDDGSYLNG